MKLFLNPRAWTIPLTLTLPGLVPGVDNIFIAVPAGFRRLNERSDN